MPKGAETAVTGVATLSGIFLWMLHVMIFTLLDSPSPNLSTSSSPPSSLSSPPSSSPLLVLVGARHGNRNPGELLLAETRDAEWARRGPLKLNQIGEEEAKRLGRQLSTTYGGEHLMSLNVLSSSAERCLETAKHIRDAFTSIFQVEIEIDDPLLRMYAVEECARNEIVWDPIRSKTNSLPTISRLLEEKADLIDKIVANTEIESTLSSLADVADNFRQLRLFSQPLPEWAASLGERFSEELEEFEERPQRECALCSPECRRLMGGVWVAEVVEQLRKLILLHEDREARLTAGPARNVRVYSSHTEVVLSTILLLGVSDITELRTAAGFVIETLEDATGRLVLRILLHSPDDERATHLFYQARYSRELSSLTVDGEEWIDARRYIEFLTPVAIFDYVTFCQETDTEE